MIRALVLIMVLLAASPVGAQGAKRFVEPLEKERVYILADTLGWVLAFHTLPEAKTATCEITTREQPGAQYRRFWEGRTSFTVYLLGDTADAQVESFTLQFDERPTEERRATAEERRANVLHLRGSATFPLQTAKRLRLRANYRPKSNAAAAFQTFDLDLGGLQALYPRAAFWMRDRCR